MFGNWKIHRSGNIVDPGATLIGPCTNMSNREKTVVLAAKNFHQKWMDLVNFHHPHSYSSKMKEALEARKAWREVRDAYDEAFAHLTAECELLRQQR